MGLKNFIAENYKDSAKMNKGVLGKAFIGLGVAELATSEKKLKSLLSLIGQIVFMKPVFAAAMVGMFGAMGKAVKSILHETGSLKAALEKLSKIQGLAKVFEPFTGGAEAAKKKVAELVKLAESKNLSLDSVATAARNLMAMSRGAQGATKELSEMADAAKATGNSLEAVAEASANFTATLRGGGDISAASEEIRKMGLMSQQTADKLTALQKAGASAGQLKEILASSIGSSAKGTGGAGVDEAAARYSGLKTKAAEAFGSGFTDHEVGQTKNYSDALSAVIPVIQDLSQWFSKLYDGLSASLSAVVKWVATIPGLNTAISLTVKGVSLLIGLVSALMAKNLIKWLWSLSAVFNVTAGSCYNFGKSVSRMTAGLVSAGNAARAASLAIRVLGWAIKATGIGLMITLAASLIGAITGLSSASEDAAREIREEDAAIRQSTDAILEKIKAIRTLSDQNEILAESIQKVADAQAEDDAARKEYELQKEKDKSRFMVWGDSSDETDSAKSEWDKARRRLNAAKTGMNAAAGFNGPLLDSDKIVEAKLAERSRASALKEQSFQIAFGSAPPEQQAAMMPGRIEELKARRASALLGVNATRDFADAGQQADINLQKAMAALASQGGTGVLETRAVEAAKRARDEVGITAPGGTSTNLFARERMAISSGDAETANRYHLDALDAQGKESQLGSFDSAVSDAEESYRRLQITNAAAAKEAQIAMDLANSSAEGFAEYLESMAAQIKSLNNQIEAEEKISPNGSAKLTGLRADLAATEKSRSRAKRDQEISTEEAKWRYALSGSSSTGIRAQEEASIARQNEIARALLRPGLSEAEKFNLYSEREDDLAGVKRAREENARASIASSRRRGIAGAELRGDSATADRLRREGEALDIYDEQFSLNGNNKEEAMRVAGDEMKTRIALDAKSARYGGAGLVVDDLARIGGGGNKATDYGAEQVDLAKQELSVMTEMKETLSRIEKKGGLK